MIYDITCNGQKHNISVDRTVQIKWRTDFNTEAFLISLECEGKNISEQRIESSVCCSIFENELKPLTEYVCRIICYGVG